MTSKSAVPADVKEEFLAKVKDGSVVVGIVGLGYVGLPLAEAYIRKGIRVIGFDIDQSRVDLLNSGKSGMAHIANARVSTMTATGLFHATTQTDMMKEADAIMICVPTPLSAHQSPDLSYVEATCEALVPIVRKGQLFALESTTYPGTTEEVMKPILEKSDLIEGVDFALAYSPEREDPGNPQFETSTIPKVVGADTELGKVMAKAIYDIIVTTVMVSNSRTAEATKLMENIYRWINIAAVNEMKIIFEAMDIDVWEVVDAAKTKPFGFHAFYPGPGVGGHCIRIDPYYLTWRAKEFGVSTRFIHLAGEVNIAMPARCVQRLRDELSDRFQKALSGSRILLVGMSYKADIDDIRESPSLELIALLREAGAHVEYHDPFIPVVPQTRQHPELAGMKSVELTPEALSGFDAALIATKHTSVDYYALCDNVPLIADSRNATAGVMKKFADKIVKV